MKWCSGLAFALLLAISAPANAQSYGSSGYGSTGGERASGERVGNERSASSSRSSASLRYVSPRIASPRVASQESKGTVRAVASSYRYQEGEAVPPAESVPAPAPQMRRAPAYDGPPVQGPDVVYEGGYAAGCDSCGSRGLCCRKPLLPLFSSCCARSCGCASVDSCCEPSCCESSCCSPTLLQRLHCQCQARWSTMTCRVRTFHQNLWGIGCCSTCGESSVMGGCGCSKGGEVWQDSGRDPLMPQAVPQPAPHDAPGPVPETDVPGKTTRRYVPSTVVPSAAWKWTPIRSSY